MKQALAYEHPHHPALPYGMVRDDVVKLLRALRRQLDISPARLDILETMISKTDASAWADPATRPVCYARQIMIAEDSGYTTRSVYDCEEFFSRLGFLEKSVGADGSRGLFGRGQLAHGLDFSPLIERMSDLVALNEERKAAIARRDVLRRQCSSARRALSRILAELTARDPANEGTCATREAMSAFPLRYADFTEAQLQHLLDSTLEAVEYGQETLNLLINTSGLSDPAFRPLIHDKTQHQTEACNGSSVHKMPARKRAEPNSESTSHKCLVQCLENKAGAAEAVYKPELTESFKPRQLYGVASDAFRFYLDAIKGDRASFTDLDFILSAQRMLYELQINALVWDDAVSAMGELPAAIALLIIDARQHDPVRPIRSPGASLRTFTKLARQDRLNLAGSLIGLIERRREVDGD